MVGKRDAMKERYERFSRGDVEGALDLWSDDIVWDGWPSTEVPGGGRHEGKSAAVQALQQAVGGYDRFELAPDRFLEDDDTVVVVGRNDVAKGGGTAVVPFVHVWSFRGEQISQLQVLTDTYRLAQILGTI
jgi:ketosteroid isomerase-like protein